MEKNKNKRKEKLFNIDEETPKKKNSPKKKKNVKKENNDQFSFDREIIIGVTKKEEPKPQVKKKKNTKKQSSKPSKNKQKDKKVEKNTKNKNVKKNVKRNIETEILQEQRQKKRKKVVHIIKYTTLSILFVSVIICAMFSPLFNIKEIQVKGNEKITTNEIVSLSKIQTEENTFKISKNKVKNQIKENAYVDKVNIKRKLPSTIIIAIEERKPVYLLEYAGGYIYLDKQGYILEISTEKLELPILQGQATIAANFEAGNRMCKEDLEKIAILNRVIELAKVNEIQNLITRIDIENIENIKLIIEEKDKIVYLGNGTNLINKIPLMKKILEETEGKSGEIFLNMDLNKENPVFRERV